VNALWLVRHGLLPPNPQRRFIGAQDIPLSPQGERQMRILAGQLAAHPLKGHVAVVCASCLDRAAQSARILVGAFEGVPLETHPGLNEISLGAWEGLTPAEVEARFPGAYALRGRDMAGYAPEGGESFAQVQRRALDAVTWLRSRHPKGILLVVAHAGVNRTLAAWHLSLPLGEVLRIPQPCGCLTMLEGQ
jgi:probable phosphoglycerate mutase